MNSPYNASNSILESLQLSGSILPAFPDTISLSIISFGTKKEASSMEREFVSTFHFPPGFRFHPSDEELIKYYLLNKVNSRPLPAKVIAETELYNYNPWELPKKALFGEDEWYFFSPRYRKYPNGVRPNRAAASGFWKATGPDKPILTSSGSRRIGVKKALVFYTGHPPKGVKTDWIMNEFRLPDTISRPLRLKGSMRLDDWVLCRVRQKGNKSKNGWEAQDSPSKLVGYQPNIEGLPSAYTDANTAIVRDWLFKDCHILASIFAGHSLPPIEAISSETFPSRYNSNNCGSVYEDVSAKGDTNVTSSSFDGFFSPTKGKPNEGSECGNLLCFTKTVVEDNKNEDPLAGNMLTTNAINFFNQNQFQGDVFNPDPLNAIMNLQELNECVFPEDFYSN